MATILVVDDDAVVVSALAHVLKSRSHTVHIARDGLQAVAALDSAAIDLVITDLRMPELDGADLVTILRSAPRGPSLIVMSGDVRSRTAVNAGRQADAVLSKPVDIDQLFDTIDALLADRAR
jgi:CheY-like chemotaxis protein